MGVVAPAFSKVIGPSGGQDAVVISWGPMVNGDTGTPVKRPDLVDRSMQVTGTFGAGGSVAVEGSNDGVNYYALSNPQGTVIAVTTAGIVQIEEATVFVRPHVTAGDGTTSLTCTMCARRTLR
ncbi:MAG TPA: hypothetical protein VIO16_06010 [Dehalococcoidia bacterium]